MSRRHDADVCLLLEGSYPFVFGGVSTWVHDLILAQDELRFELVALIPSGADATPRIDLPPNVVGLRTVALQELKPGTLGKTGGEPWFRSIEGALARLQTRGGLDDLAEILDRVGPLRDQLGSRRLLDSQAAWELMIRSCEAGQSDYSFLDFFWSWRAMLGGLWSVLLAEVPRARVYHAVSTGYAGLLAARARLESGRPAMLTEHGIYTNERRIEIAMSDWLYEAPSDRLLLGRSRRQLKDLWVDAFVGYSRVCYEACSRIVTLYEANQQFQLQDGAAADKLEVIPNGIDYEIYAGIERQRGHPPTVALIGRVVPIKDVKTFPRACAALRRKVPELRALVLGPTDEDPEYHEECVDLTRHLYLGDVVEFPGRVALTDYLGRIDVVALTSISEAQPLVLLEAGAAGVPAVATNVGACAEILLGRPGESPALGPGGAIVPLADPTAIADEIARLLVDDALRERCGTALRERVRRYYHKSDLDRAYAEIYRELGAAPTHEIALSSAG